MGPLHSLIQVCLFHYEAQGRVAHCDAPILSNPLAELRRESQAPSFLSPENRWSQLCRKETNLDETWCSLLSLWKWFFIGVSEVRGSDIISPCSCSLTKETVLRDLHYAGGFSWTSVLALLLCVPNKPLNLSSPRLLIPYKASLAINTFYVKTFQEIWVFKKHRVPQTPTVTL